MIRLLIVTGLSDSGKDELIEYISEKIPSVYVSTIDEIKFMLERHRIIEHENRKNPKYRKLISDIKNLLIDFNSNIFIEDIEFELTFTDTILITQMRENSELKKFKEHFGDECLIIKVIRSSTEQTAKDVLERDIVADWDIDNIEADIVIINDGTLSDLRNESLKIVERIKNVI